jgi:type IV secretory pathway VirJ component
VDRGPGERSLSGLRPLAWIAGLALSAVATASPRGVPARDATARVPASSEQPREDTFTAPSFGTVHVYAPAASPREVVLFLSGDGGWNLGVVPMARRLQAEGALVVGIDVRTFLAALERSRECAYPAGSLEELSRAVQLRHRLPAYRRPILVGYSSGATLVYAALAQAPPETFRGALSLGFCPDVSLHTPLCRGRGLVSRAKPKGKGWDLDPFADLGVPWTVLQGEIDQVCSPQETARFVSRVGSGRLVALPKVGHGFSVAPHWEPQYVAAYRAIAARAAPSTAVSEETGVGAGGDLAGLGLVEVSASGGSDRDLMAVLLTGDGGWAGIDKSMASHFAARGIPVVGWSSLQYYWTPRAPEEAARDLARILEHYGEAWGKRKVILAGYSFGADVLPFLVTRLPRELQERVVLVGLVGLSPQASFEFHVAGWLGVESGQHPTAPEVGRLGSTRVVCLRGEGEKDSACASLRGPALRVVTVPGGHHFDGDYERVAESILAELPGAAARP